MINSLATSVTSLTPHLSAIVACFDFWREICHPAFSDFCNTIGTSRHFAAAQQFGRFRTEADIGPDFMSTRPGRVLLEGAAMISSALEVDRG